MPTNLDGQTLKNSWFSSRLNESSCFMSSDDSGFVHSLSAYYQYAGYSDIEASKSRIVLNRTL